MFDIDQSKSIANTVIFAIGDVHGRYDLLSSIHEILDDQLSTFNESNQGLVIHLGDLIDRGPGSISCLLSALNWRHEGCESIVLPGNHEQMLLSFWESVSNCKNIVEQQQSLDLWLQCGGDAVCDELNVYDNDDIDEIIVALKRAGVPAMRKRSAFP